MRHRSKNCHYSTRQRGSGNAYMAGSGDYMAGEGIFDTISKIVNKGKEYASKAHGLYTSELGNVIRNAMPNNDATGRSGFAGESHAILKLPNGSYGQANYLGANTRTLERVKRGDVGRTKVDNTAKANDIRHLLAKNQTQAIDADRKMISRVRDIEKSSGDDPHNIRLAKLLEAKMLLEDTGLKGRNFVKKQVSPSDELMLRSTVAQMAQSGDGLRLSGQTGRGGNPAMKLKMALLRQMRGKKSKTTGKLRGKGTLMTGSGNIADFISDKVIPFLTTKLKINPQHVPKEFVRNLVNSGMDKLGDKGKMIESLSKTILPMFFKGSGISLSGNGVKSSKMKKLHKLFKIAMMSSLKGGGLGLAGKGLNPSGGRGNLSGSGFWDDFLTGFKSVIKPAIDIGSKIIPFVFPEAAPFVPIASALNSLW